MKPALDPRGVLRHPPVHWTAPEGSVTRRVVVAEDDDELRCLIAASLRDSGCDVLEARDGRELFDILAAMSPPAHLEPPDVIVSDVRMPGPSGLDGLSMLRRSTWSIPVIVITGFGDLATHDEARRLGAAIVLDKPFDLELLRTAVIALAPL